MLFPDRRALSGASHNRCDHAPKFERLGRCFQTGKPSLMAVDLPTDVRRGCLDDPHI